MTDLAWLGFILGYLVVLALAVLVPACVFQVLAEREWRRTMEAKYPYLCSGWEYPPWRTVLYDLVFWFHRDTRRCFPR